MKVFACLLLAASAVLAEPVGYNRQAPNVEIQRVEVYEVPYQESGWKPAAALQLPSRLAAIRQPNRPAALLQLPNKPAQNFRLARQEAPPSTNGVPADKYGPPAQEYGPPAEETTTETVDITTTELPITNSSSNSSKLQDKSEKFVERGVYYVYHPDGLLQKVLYATKDDIERMEYSARLRYQDVEPIRDPIYTYNPETLVLERLRV